MFYAINFLCERDVSLQVKTNNGSFNITFFADVFC